MALPILVVLGVAVVYLVPLQIKEVYRALVLGPSTSPGLLVATVASMSTLAASLFLAACHGVARARQSLIDENKEPSGEGLARILPALLAALPWIFVAVGVYDSRIMTNVPSILAAPNAVDRTSTAAVLCVVIGLLTFMVGAVGAVRERFGDQSRRFRALIVLLVLCILAGVGLCLSSVWVPQALGALSTVALAAATYTTLLTIAQSLRKLSRVPMLTITLLIVAVWAGLGVGDPHRARVLSNDARQRAEARVDAVRGPKTLIYADDAIAAWLRGRADWPEYARRGRKYPVFVVAAQGGGVYAAYHAATFLAAMQDRCGNFAQHVFAISGVSGGSVGAAVFAGLLKSSGGQSSIATCEPLQNGGPLKEAAARVLKHDLLTPVLSGFLIPDAVQALLPIRMPWNDRAARLELALEDAWDTEMPQAVGQLGVSMYDFWDPAGKVPALLFNATEVDTGAPIVLSSVPWSVRSRARDVDAYLNRGDSLRISTAAFVSARFPWITPAATVGRQQVEGGTASHVRMVDGGYFDNSGTETALALVEGLRRLSGSNEFANKIDVKLLVFSGRSPRLQEGVAFAEFLAPIRTILSLRTQRAAIAQDEAADETCSNLINFEVSEFRSYRSCLDFEEYELPLGWLISDQTANTIDRLTEFSGRCWPPEMYEEKTPVLNRIRMPNVCTISALMGELTLR